MILNINFYYNNERGDRGNRSHAAEKAHCLGESPAETESESQVSGEARLAIQAGSTAQDVQQPISLLPREER